MSVDIENEHGEIEHKSRRKSSKFSKMRSPMFAVGKGKIPTGPQSPEHKRKSSKNST